MLPLALLTTSLLLQPAAELADDLRQRSLFGHKPEYFEKHLTPLVAGMAKAEKMTLHEGLPRQPLWKQVEDRELTAEHRAKALKEKKAIESRDFYFYELTIAPDDAARKQLFTLCGDAKTFGRFQGTKMCGGFHPDWWLELKAGEDTYHVLICFGCHEARLYGPKNAIYSDLGDEAIKSLLAVLEPLHKSLPKEDKVKIPGRFSK